MSAENGRPQEVPYEDRELSMIEFKIWNVTGQAVIQANAIYDAHLPIPTRRNIGAALLGWSLGDDPQLSRVIYQLGNEIKLNWRELSTPKE